jgi:hypothetical protein
VEAADGGHRDQYERQVEGEPGQVTAPDLPEDEQDENRTEQVVGN